MVYLWMLCFLLRFACCLRTHKSVSFPCMPCKHIEGVPGFVGQSQHLVFYSFEYMPSCWYRQKASWRVGFHTSAKNELSDQNHSKSNLLSISFQRTYDLRVARLRVSDILHMVLVFQMMGCANGANELSELRFALSRNFPWALSSQNQRRHSGDAFF
jgi:hypothetical protein